ncbi:hypothetical protein DFR86_10875 [Acidianus sulfidivorans JP7]|uniref:Uncharacterized protein n=1 Tax=Acidianus sulfidivorans JP7 TaxID=619593 RepID=A0A2U9IPS4_9CREN|nr:hypothetical protein [Acidianus sulfidivorans]AWR97987.1 hypothetical protein DFR86_10875 [Acidianus sulfidivorans JP7]
MKNAIEPWGVNVPFIYLSIIMFTLGGLSLFLNDPLIGFHGYYMTIGAYSLYFGMIQRLFFPAKKYIYTQLLSLFTLALPLSHYFQAVASLFLIITEIWALKDVKGYGGKFPINLLVLSSPFASFIAWLLFTNYLILIIPIFIYILGVNIGVFVATLRARPLFGYKQIPILILIVLSFFFFKILFPLTLIVYFGILLSKRIKINLTSLTTIGVSLGLAIIVIFFGDYIHAFYLGTMASFFYSCITYSTARYNHGKVFYSNLLLILAYVLRFVNLGLSSIFFPISFLIFLYLIKDNLGIDGIKFGMSRKFLEK